MNSHLQLDAQRGELRNQRILIIDDNVSIHEDIRKILSAETQEDSDLDADAAALFGTETPSVPVFRFEIDSAFQGQEGLAMVEAAAAEGRPYAMAFVDVRMPPGWDGVQTISNIWKSYPDLQVVICTAYSDYSWEEMIRKIGHTDSLVILKKPFDNVEVLQLAHTLTHKWSLSRRLRLHLDDLDRIVARRTEELQSTNLRLVQEMQERALAQKELAQSEERFAKAFQASPIPMVLLSLETERLLDVNSAFQALTGRARIDLVAHTPAELEIFHSVEEYQLLLVQLRMRMPVRNYETRIKMAPAGIRECLFSAETFELGGDSVGLVAALDVSEQRKLESQLRHAQKLEAVGQLAAGVAHDFNNILTVIQGHTTMQLAVGALDTHVADSLRQVSAAAEKAGNLTRQLLAFSRKQIVQPKVLDVNASVRDLLDMLGRIIGEHIQLRCELADHLPGVYADEANMEQIIMNLVVNARDAMLDGGVLTIRTDLVEIDAAHVASHPGASAGAVVRLTVRDTGCGMSPEILAHIFEPFFTTKGVGKGSGLGLATVYGIVTQQEGWIEVISAAGEGSTFHVYLPACAEPGESGGTPSASDLRGGSETILVVEDEPAVRQVVTEILNGQGYNVLEAADGHHALSIWAERRNDIDLVVTDIVMPNGLRGNVLADKLQADRKDLKVIFSSGYSEDFATVDRPPGQKITFLQKPYRLEELVLLVRNCLDHNHAMV